MLRLSEFERYSEHLKNVRLRVVNRQDWTCCDTQNRQEDIGAGCEDWLLDEIEKRHWQSLVIRTPFHSVHEFPGSRKGALGTRHVSGSEYSERWIRTATNGAQECCSTGKCRTCPTGCGIPPRGFSPHPLVAARALAAMLSYEQRRQGPGVREPLSYYVSRLLAKKASVLMGIERDERARKNLITEYTEYDQIIKGLVLSTHERRLMTNDAHALVVDGIDRHGLWRRKREKT